MVSPSRAPSRGWTLALTSVASFMAALDTLVVVTALPAIQRQLQAGAASLAWIVNGYDLVLAAGIVTCAALGDRAGRRRMFAVGLALFGIASAGCALAPSIGALVLMRAVQGVGAALISPLGLTILASAFPAERRGAAVGIFAGVAGLAIALGPIVGGVLTQAWGWHSIFWVNAPIGLVTAALALAKLTESHGPATRVDPVAVVLVAAASVAIISGLGAIGEAHGIFGCVLLAVGCVLLAGFARWEASASDPMLPPRLFRSVGFTAANASSFLTTASVFASAFLITQYLQISLGSSPVQAALRFLPMTATPLVVAPVAGALSDRVGQRPVLVAGMLLQAAGLAAFAVLASPTAAYGTLVLPLVGAGVGASMPLATATTAALAAVSPADLGKASGVTRTIGNFGGFFGIGIATAVFVTRGDPRSAIGFDAGFHPALAAAAVFALVGALAALGVERRRETTTSSPLVARASFRATS